jgi:hypothetical protein
LGYRHFVRPWSLEVLNVIDDEKKPRDDLPEWFTVAENDVVKVVTGRTARMYRRGKIQDGKLRAICPVLVEAIADGFPVPAQHYLSTLMIAWMTTAYEKRRALLRDWREHDREVLKHAFRGAELITGHDPKWAIAFGTVLGLSALWEGLQANEPKTKTQAAKEATMYFELVWELGAKNGHPLQGYLRHRIRVWLAAADFNAIDKVVYKEESVRKALTAKWTAQNVLGEVKQLAQLLPADCGPIFNLAIFATVMREWTDAGSAWLLIEKKRSKDNSRYFMNRLRDFKNEPIIMAEMDNIRRAADAITRSAKR